MMDDHAAPPLSFYWLRLDETPTRPFPFGESGVTRSERSALRIHEFTGACGRLLAIFLTTGEFYWPLQQRKRVSRGALQRIRKRPNSLFREFAEAYCTTPVPWMLGEHHALWSIVSLLIIANDVFIFLKFEMRLCLNSKQKQLKNPADLKRR